jgi:hypothetical protein
MNLFRSPIITSITSGIAGAKIPAKAHPRKASPTNISHASFGKCKICEGPTQKSESVIRSKHPAQILRLFNVSARVPNTAAESAKQKAIKAKAKPDADTLIPCS